MKPVRLSRITAIHDDVIKWKHYLRYWPFVRGIHRPTVNSLHKGQWRRALMFSLICSWVNGWVNNREAGDLRRHYGHYDVTAMPTLFSCCPFPHYYYSPSAWSLTCDGTVARHSRPITAANPLIEIYQWLIITELLQQGFGSYGISWNNTPVILFLCWHVEAWIKWHYICIVKHIEAETKWPLFSRRHFQMYFHEWKCMNFD